MHELQFSTGDWVAYTCGLACMCRGAIFKVDLAGGRLLGCRAVGRLTLVPLVQDGNVLGGGGYIRFIPSKGTLRF
jgi:hypothetical protein